MCGALTGWMKNIDFQTTILSRFDMIFIVKDEHNEQRDRVSGHVAWRSCIC